MVENCVSGVGVLEHFFPFFCCELFDLLEVLIEEDVLTSSYDGDDDGVLGGGALDHLEGAGALKALPAFAQRGTGSEGWRFDLLVAVCD